MKARAHDCAACLVLILATLAFGRAWVRFDLPPVEDAAMLMRYASHLAQGHGLVWNVGDPPVDGATDFLFLMAVGGVHACGFGLEAAVQLLTVGAHLATVLLIYLGLRRLHGAGILVAGLAALYFAVGPGLFYASAGFGTPFFALWAAAAWIAALRIMNGNLTDLAYASFALCALAMGLTRPEGVLVAGFMLLAVCAWLGASNARRAVVWFAAVFLLLGGAYFLWRWNYFGHPLPNPFHKKGGGRLYPESLRVSIRKMLGFCWPFLPAFVLSIRSGRLTCLAICYAVPIAGATGMWILLSDEMNFAGRFQYVVFPLAVLSWYPLVASAVRDFKLPSLGSLDLRSQLAVVGLGAAVLLATFALRVRDSRRYVRSTGEDVKYEIARMLTEFAGRGYTLCTTEAGLLPLYSRWRSIDAWGLNDAWIAHHGGITREYLESHAPELIVWHGYFSPVAASRDPQLGLGPHWHRMVEVLKAYAEEHDYVLAGAFGESPYDTQYYYVSRAIPECREIVARIRSVRHSGINYALLRPGSTPSLAVAVSSGE